MMSDECGLMNEMQIVLIHQSAIIIFLFKRRAFGFRHGLQ
jgi:hypothetical protein